MVMWFLGFGMFLISVTVHEFAHGFVATCLGDDTALRRGRLSLNPMKHIDLFWTILLPVSLYVTSGGRFVIGQAKPVPVDFRKLKPNRLGMMAVALAGPGMNFFMAFLFSVLYRQTAWVVVLLFGVYLNLALGIFNLLPIPPLDGSRVITGFLPKKWLKMYDLVEPYGFIIVVVLVYFGVIRHVVISGINFFSSVYNIPHV